MFRSIVLGAAGAAAMIASASATDLYSPAEPVPVRGAPYIYAPLENWAGFYVGLNGGYSFFDPRFVERAGVNAFWGQPGDRFKTDAYNGFGGGQVGYNFQNGRLVYGLEGIFDGIGADNSVRSPRIPGDYFRTQISEFGAITGRLGYAFGGTLVYTKVGYAIADMTLRGRNGPTFFSSDDTLSGFVVGGGVEFQIAPRWVLGIDYNYLDFGSESFQASDNNGLGFKSEASVTGQTVGARLNYKLGAAYEPLK